MKTWSKTRSPAWIYGFRHFGDVAPLRSKRWTRTFPTLAALSAPALIEWGNSFAMMCLLPGLTQDMHQFGACLEFGRILWHAASTNAQIILRSN